MRGRPREILSAQEAFNTIERRRENTRRWVEKQKRRGWLLYSIWVPPEAYRKLREIGLRLRAEAERESEGNDETYKSI